MAAMDALWRMGCSTCGWRGRRFWVLCGARRMRSPRTREALLCARTCSSVSGSYGGPETGRRAAACAARRLSGAAAAAAKASHFPRESECVCVCAFFRRRAHTCMLLWKGRSRGAAVVIFVFTLPPGCWDGDSSRVTRYRRWAGGACIRGETGLRATGTGWSRFVDAICRWLVRTHSRVYDAGRRKPPGNEAVAAAVGGEQRWCWLSAPAAARPVAGQALV